MHQLLGSTRFTAIRVGLVIYGSLFSGTHLVAKDLLNLNNAINNCISQNNNATSQNIILYHASSLNVY